MKVFVINALGGTVEQPEISNRVNKGRDCLTERSPLAILSDNMRRVRVLAKRIPPTGGSWLRLFFIWVWLVAAAALLAGCGGEAAEPAAALPTVETQTAPPSPTAAPASALPTPAQTLTAPSSPTPPPTSTVDPIAAAIIATQTAAANPPTPPITVEATAESIVNEPMPTPWGIYSWTLKVPILMYHYVSEPPPNADIYRVDLSVSPDSFRQQMNYLKENGYTPIDFYELSTAIVAHTELPEKPVLLTFDDGYLDNYTEAYPILQEHGFKGNFFVVTEFVDLGREGYMTWEMIEEMARNGQRIESHSRTHPDLSTKSRDSLIWEILGSQETLAAHIGYRPRYFCYPGGTYNAETIQVLQELDFWGAVTTANGSWHGFDDRFEWRRVRIRNSTSMQEFARLVDLEGTIRGKPPGS